MNKILYVFGAGDGAIELIENFEYCFLSEWKIYCIEDSPSKNCLKIETGIVYKSIPIFSYLKFHNLDTGSLINSVMDCNYKEKIYKENKDGRWRSFALNCNRIFCQMPIGCIIMPQSFIGSTVRLGKFVKVNHGAKLLVNSSVGDYSFIGTNSMLLANSKVGSKTLIYSGVTILPNINIGNNTIIGAGSVVTKDVGDNVLAYGNPCKVVRENEG